jgi:secondary thiamine-phosphate synthase enzyme
VLNVQQTKLKLSPLPRGIHLITSEVQSALHQLGVRGSGLVHVFIQHTSASLSLNENADADVRLDMEDHLDDWCLTIRPSSATRLRVLTI